MVSKREARLRRLRTENAEDEIRNSFMRQRDVVDRLEKGEDVRIAEFQKPNADNNLINIQINVRFFTTDVEELERRKKEMLNAQGESPFAIREQARWIDWAGRNK